MDLNTLWFALIAILFTGYFFLEGFDYGVGILLPFLGRDDDERRLILNTIGPFWDGNEVWLLTAGGATFAVFPHWYATLFSGFYLPLVLMLLGLILRGVAIEFRSKDKAPAWRKSWDWLIGLGSLMPALLWGVAFGNFILGVPIDAKMNYAGGFLNLLNPYALLIGLLSLGGFMLHGAVFLSLRTQNDTQAKAQATATRLWLPVMVVFVLSLAATFVVTDLLTRLGIGIIVPLLALVTLLLAGWRLKGGRVGWAFILTGLTIVLANITVFLGLYPRVMISSLKPEWSLTIYNASSSPYTLTVMTVIALILVPIVLIYQGWTYYIFRERIGRGHALKY